MAAIRNARSANPRTPNAARPRTTRHRERERKMDSRAEVMDRAMLKAFVIGVLLALLMVWAWPASAKDYDWDAFDKRLAEMRERNSCSSTTGVRK